MNSQTITWDLSPNRTKKVIAFLAHYFKTSIKLIILFMAANVLLRSDTSIQLNTSSMLPVFSATKTPPNSSAMFVSSPAPAQPQTPTYAHLPIQTQAVPPSPESEAGLFLNPLEVFDEAESKPTVKVKKKRRDCQAYIKRFKGTAISEMKKYGIPASITLAQGILESNGGISRLAEENNNHFGMKCFSTQCAKGHCTNFHDDDHKDFFRKYNTAWESYRAHSLLLATSKRYRPLYKLKRTDYKGWAKGLKKAGYATGKQYDKKLIKLIESLDLAQYDK